MKKLLIKSFLVLCFIMTIVFSYHIINSFAENSLTNYNMNLSFDDKAKSLTGSEEITYTNNYSADLNKLVLHLYPNSLKDVASVPSIGQHQSSGLADEQIGEIKIEKVQIDNKPADFNASNQLLSINLAAPLKKGDQITFVIDFTVKIPGYTADRLHYSNDVFSIADWYPIMSIYNTETGTWDENEFNPIGESNYSDVSNYHVKLSTPKDIVTAATGTIEKESISGGTKTIEIQADKVRDFVFMMSRYFKIISKTVDGINFKSYYIDDPHANNSLLAAKKYLDVVIDSEQFYSKVYGKYPYSKLDIVETYLDGGAMEYPTLIQMGKYSTLTPAEMNTHTSWMDDAAAHETGHQWWYVAVGDNEFKEPIMDETINTYSTAYYFESRYGKYNPNSITMQIRNHLIDAHTLPINSSVDKFSSWGEYTRVIYDKGPEAFEDLRTKIGDKKFFEIMRTYFSRFLYKNGSVKDFTNLIGEIAGQDAKAYFEAAINSNSYYPTNIEATPMERIHIQNVDIINDLVSRESLLGVTIGSMLLKGLNGEPITLVVPSRYTKINSKNIFSYINNMKSKLEKDYDVKINVINDNQLRTKLLSENLIVLESLNNNKVMSEFKNYLPNKVVSNGQSYDLSNKNTSGIYLIKNPKNSSRMLMVIFWNSAFREFDFTSDNMDQYILDNGIQGQIRGRF